MLAIIIPYYKLTFFEATLQSLVSQTDHRFNVYIGDDASPESPNDLLEKYQRKFNFEYRRFEENLGRTSLTQQWERCIALSRNEEWIMILGDDDFLEENVVQAFYSNLLEIEKEGINVVRFSTQKIDDEGKFISETYYHPRIENSVDFLFKEKKRNSLSEYIFRRSQIIEIGFNNFPLAWCSDILAVLEFSNFNLVYSINEAILYIRISALSISGSQDNVRMKNLASEEFSSFIIFKNFKFFNKTQRLSILNGYETAIKTNRKLKIGDWFTLFKLYIKNFNLVHIFKFLRRFIIDVFNL